jgi:hypothetical protein
MTWRCFWTEPTGEAEIGLRRYVARPAPDAWTCDAGWHEAFVWLGERRPYVPVTHEDGHSAYPLASDVLRVRKNDRRWPKTCDRCDYRFIDDDRKQVWAEALYRRTDTDELRVWHNKPAPAAPIVEPGGMRDAWWLHGFSSALNPERPKDGIVLSVLCPYMTGESGGWDWSPDMRASSGGYWKRVGDPRNPPSLTVSPSIAIGPNTSPRYYHGFLQAGRLTDHVG